MQTEIVFRMPEQSAPGFYPADFIMLAAAALLAFLLIVVLAAGARRKKKEKRLNGDASVPAAQSPAADRQAPRQ